MPYCTQSDIEKMIPTLELAELTTESGSTPDADIVTEMIGKAEAEIDAYCGTRYVIPFATVPTIVESLCVDMAIYHLYSRRSVAPEVRRQKYDDAIKFLKDVSAGKALLGETASPPDSAAGDNEPVFYSTDRIFGRDTMYDL